MSTNENDLLARIAARRAASAGSPDIRQRIADRRAATLQQMLFSRDVQREDEAYTPEPSNYRDANARTVEAVRTAAQGLTFGFGDEIEGGVRAALTDTPYREARDEARAGVEWARKEHPAVALGLEGVSGLLLPLGAAKAAPRLAGLARGKGAVGALKTAASAGVAGGAYGVGMSEREGVESLRDAAGPAAVSAALTPALRGVGAMSRWALANPVKAAGAGAAGGVGISSLDSQSGVRDTGEDAAKGALALALLPQVGRRVAAMLPRVGGDLGDRMVLDAARADLGPDMAATIQARMRLAGPNRAAQMRAMDLGENLRGVAVSGAGVQGSTARAVLPAFVEDRGAGRLAGPEGPGVMSRLGRMTGDVEEVFGQRAGQSRVTREGLEEARARQAAADYDAARAAPDIDPSDPRAANVLAGLDQPAMQRYVRAAQAKWEQEQAARVFQGLPREEWNPQSVRAVELVKRAIGDAEGRAVRSGAADAARLEGNTARSLRGQVADPDSPLVPELARADRNYAAASRDVDAAYLGSGQVPPGANQASRPRFTSPNYHPEDFARDWRQATTPEQKTAAIRSIVDDVVGALNQPAAQGQELKLLGRYADSNQAAKLREVIGDEGLNVLTGRQTMEEAFSRSERALSPMANSKTATTLSDINILQSPKEWVALAIQRVWPQLRVSKPAANRIGDLNQLSLEDFARVVTEMERIATEVAENRGLTSTALGVAAGRLAGPSGGQGEGR